MSMEKIEVIKERAPGRQHSVVAQQQMINSPKARHVVSIPPILMVVTTIVKIVRGVFYAQVVIVFPFVAVKSELNVLLMLKRALTLE